MKVKRTVRSDQVFWVLFYVMALLCALQLFDLLRGRSREAAFGTLFLVTPAALATCISGIVNIRRFPPERDRRQFGWRLAAIIVAGAIFIFCIDLWLNFMVAQGWIDLPIIIKIG